MIPLVDRRREEAFVWPVPERIQQLEQASAQLKAVLNASSLVGIIATSMDGVITLFNRGAERMLGYRAEEVVGKATPSLFHSPSEIEAHSREIAPGRETTLEGSALFREMVRQDTAEQSEWFFVRKDGTTFPGLVALTALRDEEGVPTGLLGIVSDLSDRKLQQERLEKARIAAEAASLAKSEFLATMSHEIRTPMNGILGMAGLLLDSGLSGRQRKQAQILRDSAESLLGVLNDILDFSKIEARKLELEFTDFDLRAVVESVADLMAVRAAEKHLELLCFIEPAVPTRLRGDPGRLRQVLMNLVGNAVKFTNCGEVLLRVRHDGSQADLVRFEVTDTGAGVPPEKRSLLFQPFCQVDASTARQHGGTGLGLSIVRGLVEIMGGSVGFEPAEAGGSTFWFTATLSKQSVMRPSPLSLAGKRILIVDDNRASRRLLMELAAYWRCDAETAHNARAALHRLRQAGRGHFDAALIDLDMPDMGGDRLGQLIREEPRLPDLSLILLTPQTHAQSAAHWRQLGFAARVVKPVKQGELGAALASAFHYAPLPDAGGAGQPTAAPSQPELRSSRRLLVVEDNAVNQEVAAALLERLGYSFDVAPEALAALDVLSRIPYALILMDCHLPGMDGYQLTQAIRDPATRVLNHRLPIVAMTASAMSGDRAKCLAAGMDDYLSKPIQPVLLEQMLDHWTAEIPPDAPLDGFVFSRDIATKAGFDETDLLDRLMGNENLARRLVGRFLEDMPRQLIALSDALQRADAPNTRLLAHSIKGSAANVSGVTVSKLAARIEQMDLVEKMDAAAELLPDLASSFEALRPAMQRFCGRDAAR